MEQADIARDSAEYAEIITEVLMETIQKATVQAMRCEGNDGKITPSLMGCLQYIYLHGASPIREIANGLDVSLSAASQLVDRLFRMNLVTRKENETDRRLTSVELKQPGRELVKRMRAKRSERFETIINAMPKDKRNAFLDGVESFLLAALADDDETSKTCIRCGREHVSFCVVNKVLKERADAGKD